MPNTAPAIVMGGAPAIVKGRAIVGATLLAVRATCASLLTLRTADGSAECNLEAVLTDSGGVVLNSSCPVFMAGSNIDVQTRLDVVEQRLEELAAFVYPPPPHMPPPSPPPPPPPSPPPPSPPAAPPQTPASEVMAYNDLAAVTSFCASIEARGLRLGVYVNNMPGAEAHIGLFREGAGYNSWASGYTQLEKVPAIASYLSPSGFVCGTGVVNWNQGQSVSFSQKTRVFQLRDPGWSGSSSVTSSVSVPSDYTSSWNEITTGRYGDGATATLDSYSAMFIFFPDCAGSSCAP